MTGILLFLVIGGGLVGVALFERHRTPWHKRPENQPAGLAHRRLLRTARLIGRSLTPVMVALGASAVRAAAEFDKAGAAIDAIAKRARENQGVES